MRAQMPLKSADQLVGEKNRALLAIWQDAAGGRAAPRREDITLARLRGLSACIWIADVVDDGKDFRFRLIGDRIQQFYGLNFGGQYLSALPDRTFAGKLSALQMQCVAAAGPVAYGPAPSSYTDKSHFEVEAILLPLSDDGSRITALIGLIEFWPRGTHGRRAPGRADGNSVIPSV
jgi:hypothetical protein